ncbi:MAG: diaminohydroxyphosphoribosylaminopyrimidine deaminase [Litorivivens sp.]|jgi:diaminohydroxyphosphoribosylaminopyrimidine deaminase/5-amino-6-(5-phosphoribosylamino)uracil reductase
MAKTPEYYMQRCLDLASEGRGKVSPNPLVGCVIVRDDTIIGQGYHEQYGGPHAEVNAFRSLQSDEVLTNAIVFVNLEPCSHHGKTPPCIDLIIKSKIPRVVVGMTDPNPLVSGSGIQKLREAGIQVIEEVLTEECEILNRRFILNQVEKRPYIILKWAQSADGFIDPNRADGQKGIQWITGPESQELTHGWRADEDAILVGRKTVEIDNPLLTVRTVEGKNPVRIAIDPKQVLSKDKAIFDNQSRTIVLASEGIEDKNTHVVPMGPFWLNTQLNKLLTIGIGSVIVEGGRHTLDQFIEHGYWDEARVLTGANSFGAGISAPKLKGTLQEDFTSGPDRVQVYSKK